MIGQVMAIAKTTRATAERLAQYQAEVLNKCEGRAAAVKPLEWKLICKVGWYVPEGLIMQALGKMQDERQRRTGPRLPDAPPHVDNLTRYYFATVRSMCRERGIDSGINWKE